MASGSCIGVILAAGRGRRMGRLKQLVPWPTADASSPLVAAAYDAVRPVCDEVVVVLGHDVEAVAAALGDRPFHRVLSNPDAPMFESIRAGFIAARETNARATIVLQPGDHPQVAPTTLTALLEASSARPAMAVVPEYVGRGGHPVFIPPVIAALLIMADCPEGLGQFWSDHPDLCYRLAVDDPAVLRDIDTPSDLTA